MAIAIGVGKMFLLDVVSSNNQALNVRLTNVTTLWHRRYGHMNRDYLITLQKNELVCGLPSLVYPSNICCTCIARKQHRVPFGDSTHCVKGPLDVIHTDLCGPIGASISGLRYFLLFIDDYSRKMWVYFLKTKDQTFSYFKEFKALVGNKLLVISMYSAQIEGENTYQMSFLHS